MVERLTLLVLVLAVAAGLVTATASALLVHSRRTAFFRYFLANILLFNLLVLAGLVFRFAVLEMQGEEPALGETTRIALLASMGALKLAWLYAFACVTLVLPGTDVPKRFRRRFLVLGVPSMLVWAALLFFGVRAGLPALTEGVLAILEFAVIGGGVASCLVLLSRAKIAPTAPRRDSLRVFGGLHLAFFVVILASVGISYSRGAEQASSQVLFNSLLLVVYNLLPLAWILRFQPMGRTMDPATLERYGITPREKEIIELIKSGHTNREIADLLFISLATVKDHNYNIFRKTGVRNRVELSNLFGGAGRPHEDGLDPGEAH